MQQHHLAIRLLQTGFFSAVENSREVQLDEDGRPANIPHLTIYCSDHNLLAAEHACIVQTAPTDNLEKPLEGWDMGVVGREDLNDLLDDIWKDTHLLVHALPQLFWHRHMWLLHPADDSLEKPMVAQADQDEVQGAPKAKSIFSLIEKYLQDLNLQVKATID